MSNKSKRKRNRRKERRRKNISAKMLKFLGVNSAGLLSKEGNFAVKLNYTEKRNTKARYCKV